MSHLASILGGLLAIRKLNHGDAARKIKAELPETAIVIGSILQNRLWSIARTIQIVPAVTAGLAAAARPSSQSDVIVVCRMRLSGYERPPRIGAFVWITRRAHDEPFHP
jgi:hypothetical protein